MTRLLAWANVNQLFMALNNTGDKCHVREGKVRIVIYHKPDREACCTVTVRQTKNKVVSNPQRLCQIRGTTNNSGYE